MLIRVLVGGLLLSLAVLGTGCGSCKCMTARPASACCPPTTPCCPPGGGTVVPPAPVTAGFAGVPYAH